MAAQTNSSPAEAWPTGEKDYQSFSSLPVQVNGNDIAKMATPALAMAWADATVAYWESEFGHQRIHSDQPLYVLDLNPDRGQFVWLMLKALRAKLNGSPFQPCYLACSTQAETLGELSQHPYLQSAIENNSFDTALLHPAYDSLHLQHQKQTLLRTDNPIVIIGLGHFQTLPSELFGVHHGKILEGRVAPEPEQDDEKNYRLDYQWTDVTAPNFAASLLATYRARCSSTPVLLPLAACAQLEALSRIASGRYLLLSADHGICSEKAIRLGALNPPAAMSDSGIAIPVNTHALHLHQQLQGAFTWHQQLSDDGLAVFVACGTGDKEFPTSAFNTIIDQLAAAHPDDLRHENIASTNPASAAFYLSLLRRSHYDPNLLKAIIQSLIDRTELIDDSLRQNWQTALERCMANYFPNARNDGLTYQAGLLAIGLGDFYLAKLYFRFSLDWYGDDATELYLLAYCEAASGGVANAVELLAQALAREPEHTHALVLQDSLQQRLARWRQNAWYLPQHASADILHLEPLGHEHAPALLYQYRDRQIGIMTRLPELDTEQQVQDWISEQEQDQGRASFAVMHEYWGLVGVVSIHCAGDAGYFYFWIGSDFQDQGLGQQAAQLLFGLMVQQGVKNIFTSAYEDNLRSMHALTKLGFGKLEIKAKEPDENLVFFHLGQRGGSTDEIAASRETLIELCRAIESPLEVL